MDPRVYLEHIGEKFANLEAGQKLEGFRETGLTKSLYLDIIEKVIDIYTTEYLWKMAKGEIDFVICIGLRAAGAIAYLLSEGRRPDLYELWLSLMYSSTNLLKPPLAYIYNRSKGKVHLNFIFFKKIFSVPVHYTTPKRVFVR
jgi:hypothetical protein